MTRQEFNNRGNILFYQEDLLAYDNLSYRWLRIVPRLNG